MSVLDKCGATHPDDPDETCTRVPGHVAYAPDHWGRTKEWRSAVHKKVEIIVTDTDTGKVSTITYHRVEDYKLDAKPEIDERDFVKWLARGGQGIAPQVTCAAIVLAITGRAVPDEAHDGEIAEARGGRPE